MTRRIALLLTLLVAGCASVAPDDTPTEMTRYQVRDNCGGRQNCFTGIQAALDASERDVSESWIRVDVPAGDFHEKVTIRRSRVNLQGAGLQRTRLHFDAVAQDAGRFHRDRWGTAGSATLTINADQVTVSGMTVENTFDYLANDVLQDSDPRKIANSQALAVLLDISSDRVLLDQVALVGFQDTLFGNGKRALVRNSFISGNVDFIFGNGQLLIVDSTIESRRRAATFKPGEFQSFIVAPSTQLSQPMGIVIYRSRLTREPGVPDGSVGLGRPWHPTTTFPDGRYADPRAVGQASFIDCHMDAHIHPEHWASMNGTARDGSKSDVFLPQDSRFAESGSSGPGARGVDLGIKWKDAPGIEQFKTLFFEGWSIRQP
jgi:pectinesterase